MHPPLFQDHRPLAPSYNSTKPAIAFLSVESYSPHSNGRPAGRHHIHWYQTKQRWCAWRRPFVGIGIQAAPAYIAFTAAQRTSPVLHRSHFSAMSTPVAVPPMQASACIAPCFPDASSTLFKEYRDHEEDLCLSRSRSRHAGCSRPELRTIQWQPVTRAEVRAPTGCASKSRLRAGSCEFDASYPADLQAAERRSPRTKVSQHATPSFGGVSQQGRPHRRSVSPAHTAIRSACVGPGGLLQAVLSGADRRRRDAALTLAQHPATPVWPYRSPLTCSASAAQRDLAPAKPFLYSINGDSSGIYFLPRVPPRFSPCPSASFRPRAPRPRLRPTPALPRSRISSWSTAPGWTGRAGSRSTTS